MSRVFFKNTRSVLEKNWKFGIRKGYSGDGITPGEAPPLSVAFRANFNRTAYPRVRPKIQFRKFPGFRAGLPL